MICINIENYILIVPVDSVGTFTVLSYSSQYNVPFQRQDSHADEALNI